MRVAVGRVIDGRQQIRVAERSARYMRRTMDMCFNAARGLREEGERFIPDQNMLSTCCDALSCTEIVEGFGRCSDCKEMADFYDINALEETYHGE